MLKEPSWPWNRQPGTRRLLILQPRKAALPLATLSTRQKRRRRPRRRSQLGSAVPQTQSCSGISLPETSGSLLASAEPDGNGTMQSREQAAGTGTFLLPFHAMLKLKTYHSLPPPCHPIPLQLIPVALAPSGTSVAAGRAASAACSCLHGARRVPQAAAPRRAQP